MQKIKKVKIIAEMDDGKEMEVLVTNHDNAMITFERDFREVSFDGEVIKSTSTGSYTITVRDMG